MGLIANLLKMAQSGGGGGYRGGGGYSRGGYSRGGYSRSRSSRPQMSEEERMRDFAEDHARKELNAGFNPKDLSAEGWGGSDFWTDEDVAASAALTGAGGEIEGWNQNVRILHRLLDGGGR